MWHDITLPPSLHFMSATSLRACRYSTPAPAGACLQPPHLLLRDAERPMREARHMPSPPSADAEPGKEEYRRRRRS